MERILGGFGIETPYPQTCSQASAPKPSYKICAVENSLRYLEAMCCVPVLYGKPLKILF